MMPAAVELMNSILICAIQYMMRYPYRKILSTLYSDGSKSILKNESKYNYKPCYHNCTTFTKPIRLLM